MLLIDINVVFSDSGAGECWHLTGSRFDHWILRAAVEIQQYATVSELEIDSWNYKKENWKCR